MLALLVAVALSAEPEQIAEYLERCEAARLGEINRLQDGLKRLASGKARSAAGPAEDRKRMAEIRAEITALNKGKQVFAPLRFPFKAGDLGAVGKCKIQQIIDSQNALVEQYVVTGTKMERIGGIPVTVPAGRKMLFWIETPTDGLVDDAPHDMQGVWEIAGTKQYDTVSGGTQTVYVLRQVDSQLLRKPPGVSPRPKSSRPDPAGSAGIRPL